MAPGVSSRQTVRISFCALALHWAAAQTSPFAVTVDASSVTNPDVSRRTLGCHHDYGYAQAPRAFTANIVYGSSFEAGTLPVPAWTTRVSGPSARASVAPTPAFNGKPTMAFNIGWGAPDGTEAAAVNRGIGGAGFALVGGQPYTFEAHIYNDPKEEAICFAELRDFTTNTSLARFEFPATNASWARVVGELVPSAGTACAYIANASDPSIYCGAVAGPSHACQRCGGELVVGLAGTGQVNVGFVSLSPGPWGLLAAPDGTPLPVLKSGADLLSRMGVTVLRSGGTVSRDMQWKQWRGPVPFRASQQLDWHGSLLSGWGPFEVGS